MAIDGCFANEGRFDHSKDESFDGGDGKVDHDGGTGEWETGNGKERISSFRAI